MGKIYDPTAAVLDGLLFDGMTIVAGGFGLCGSPEKLIEAIHASGVKDLTVVSNNAGGDGFGLGMPLHSRQVKVVESYVGENKEFERQYLAGELELQFAPQGTLPNASAPAGRHPSLYTKTGVDTTLAECKEHKVLVVSQFEFATNYTRIVRRKIRRLVSDGFAHI